MPVSANQSASFHSFPSNLEGWHCISSAEYVSPPSEQADGAYGINESRHNTDQEANEIETSSGLAPATILSLGSNMIRSRERT